MRRKLIVLFVMMLIFKCMFTPYLKVMAQCYVVDDKNEHVMETLHKDFEEEYKCNFNRIISRLASEIGKDSKVFYIVSEEIKRFDSTKEPATIIKPKFRSQDARKMTNDFNPNLVPFYGIAF